MVFADNNFLIGVGSSGTQVYVGLHNDGREAAVKRVLMNHAERMNEADLLPYLKCKNIAFLMITEEVNGQLYIATSLYDYTLEEWLTEIMKQSSWNDLIPDRVEDLLKALHYLHTQNSKVLHCDLTPENILVARRKGAYLLKLGDFGISGTVPSGQTGYCRAPAGTPCWKAREVLNPVQGCVTYTESSDIQVAGMVSFYMMSGKTHPYGSGGHFDVENNIAKGSEPIVSSVKDEVGIDLVGTMLKADPTKRPSANDLLNFKNQSSVVGKAIENIKSMVLPTLNDGTRSWKHLSVIPKLGKHFEKDLKRPVYTESVRCFLLFLRNIKTHYSDESTDAQKTLGKKDCLYAYFSKEFSKEFPLLFPEVYLIIKNTAGSQDDWVHRDSLKKFF
ncbi:Serine/threonine-protein kinase D2 [Lamellibrachia satsuma]|nr:Serine/threonine-protein kinase D2 [Lamellibrachia satsuma]